MECDNDTNPAAVRGEDESVRTQENRETKRPVSGEIPFLITHWLDGMTTEAARDPTSDHTAIQSIRNATATLASAFSSLGSFGQRSATAVSNSTSFIGSMPTPVNRTYADMKRTWAAACPPNHLEHLLESSDSVNETLDAAANANAPINSEKRCGEVIIEHRRTSPGRTLNDAIDVERSDNVQQVVQTDQFSRVRMALQKPPLVQPLNDPRAKETCINYSSLDVLRRAASTSKRKYLETLQQSRQEELQIRTHQKSLDYQRKMLSSLQENSSGIGSDPAVLDDIESSKQNCRRVIAQIERALPSLLDVHLKTTLTLKSLQAESRKSYERLNMGLAAFRDPLKRKPDYKGNLRLHRAVRQQLMGYTSRKDIQKSLLYNRLAHAGTINTHLTYPVFCLKFDKTGRYFITGADDYLVKVFCLANALHRRIDGEPIRGAVLVSTLKGHAGVINDIQVSTDNCFVATASEDGDVRVWGLHNGCPIAILRGHMGGANMVSWCLSTPYRLVTTGADGLARVWDIRHACLNRYRKFVNKRVEYTKRLPRTFKQVDNECLESGTSTEVAPSRSGETNITRINEVPLPPLPMAPGAVNHHQENQDVNNSAGSFVANDRIDEGVKLVSKLRHGTLEAPNADMPGTRSRLSSVKVICVARCPKGGHFATGSDDGVCRVWRDIPDSDILKMDRYQISHAIGALNFNGPSGCHDARLGGEFVDLLYVQNTQSITCKDDKPLLELKGDPSAITDLEYSKHGDRLMAASQKDGTIRIWSWSIDPSVLDQSAVDARSKRIVSHILIKLSNPKSKSSVERSRPHSRANRGQETNRQISCDVARWLSDGLRIVTSQCEYTRRDASSIIPGSQFLFIWDSLKGNCLMCIDNPHRMQCPLVLSHPHIPSILCSAGADGWMKVWNLEHRECLFSFENLAEYGPFDPNDRGKSVGFLDGDFSPDGVDLVLTDDSGRVSVFSSNGKAPTSSFPGWAREQYFSNDYYDLIYDTTGYCVERGSESPPHLAPKGSRCTHSGSPFSAHVNETLQNIPGPLPLDKKSSSWARLQTFAELKVLQSKKYNAFGNIIGRFDPNTTVVISSDVGEHAMEQPMFATNVSGQSIQSGEGDNNRRHLSSNYRWMDYEDLEHEAVNDDNEVVDPDDEEFDPSENRRRASRPQTLEHDSASEDDQLDGFDAETMNDDSPVRARRRRDRESVEQDSSEESADEHAEMLSTNNTPSGPFVGDYSSHLFKLANHSKGDSVHRRWLQRIESTSLYEGRRRYAPQIGDYVVYIPRAHFDTIARFRTLEAPWLNWPDNSTWPVVQCCIRNIRYRFPYRCYRKSCRSIVAKLTLELTGVPQDSPDRGYHWPAPLFHSPPTAHVFEISLFANNETDFLVPFGLYQSRLQQLEKAWVSEEAVLVDAFYATENEDEEFLSYNGRVDKSASTADSVDQPGLVGSGYHAVGVIWPEEIEPSTDLLSPWEISVRSPESAVSSPSRPRLTDDDKKIIRDTLNHLRSMPEVTAGFGLPVSEAYIDYRSRVEVPIDLSFVADRIEADYYATKFSFVADLRLIVTNCIKYNGEGEPLCFTAQHMLEEAMNRVLNESERNWFTEYDDPLPEPQPTGNLLQWDQLDQNRHVEQPAVQTQRRNTQQTLSSFENLPQADDNTRRSSRPTRPPRRLVDTQAPISRRSSRRMPSRQPLHTRNTRAASRSVLEGPIRTLEQLSSSSGAALRGRTTGHLGRVGRNEQANPNVRRSLRNRHEIPIYQSARPGLRNSQPNRAATSLRSNQGNTSEVRLSDQGRSVSSLRVEEAAFADTESSAEEEYIHAGDMSEASSDEETESIEKRSRPRRQARRKIEYSDHESLDSETIAGTRRNGTRRRQGVSKKSTSSENDSKMDGVAGEKPRMSDLDSGEEYHEASSEELESDEDEEELESSSASGEYRVVSKRQRQSQAPSRLRPRRPAVTAKRKRSRQSTDDDGAGSHRRPDEEDSADGSDDEEDSLDDRVVSKRKGRAPQRQGPRRRGVSETSEPSRKRGRQSKEDDDATRHHRSRTRGVRAVYEDPSSSDFEDDTDENASPADRKPPPSKKRKGSNDAKRKRKLYIQKRIKHYGLSPWREIALGHITNVTNEIVKRFKELDEEGIFHLPVAVAHPGIAQTYKKSVSFPMDFRTIVEDRLQLYQSIRELQEDLLLVFDNCILFNEEGSQYHDTATTMIDLMEGTFEGVLDDLNVRSLRH